MHSLGDDETEARDVWIELQETVDPMDRECLLIRLAEFACSSHDFSDPNEVEEVHEQFGLLRKAQEDYHLAALRVGRYVARMMEAQQVLKNYSSTDENSN